MMTPEKKTQVAAQAAVDMAITQRNANANDAVQMAAEIAVLKATIAERDTEIAELKKVAEPLSG